MVVMVMMKSTWIGVKTTGFGHSGDDDIVMSPIIHNKTDYDADSNFHYHYGEVDEEVVAAVILIKLSDSFNSDLWSPAFGAGKTSTSL